ncbi:MAG: hypothetical protein WC958_00860 [Dehalococcoidales bacterium]
MDIFYFNRLTNKSNLPFEDKQTGGLIVLYVRMKGSLCKKGME